MEDLNMKTGDTIEVTGTYFPLSLLGPGSDFMKTIGVTFADECIICLDEAQKWQKSDVSIFQCGHVNVCKDCFKQQGLNAKTKCPQCIVK